VFHLEGESDASALPALRAGIAIASDDADWEAPWIMGDYGVGYAAWLVAIHHPSASVICDEVIEKAGVVGILRRTAGRRCNWGWGYCTCVLDWILAVREANEVGLEVFEAGAAAAVRADERFRLALYGDELVGDLLADGERIGCPATFTGRYAQHVLDQMRLRLRGDILDGAVELRVGVHAGAFGAVSSAAGTLDAIAVNIVYAVGTVRLRGGSVGADLLRDLNLVGRKELLAVGAEVGHVTGDDQHEHGAAAVELDGLEVAGVYTDEVILIVEAGSSEVHGGSGGWFGRCGCRCGRARGSGSRPCGLCIAKRDEGSDETEDEHSHGVAPCFAEAEQVQGRWRYREFYTRPTAERKIIGADPWRMSRISALASDHYRQFRPKCVQT
jgi:hypothetical protein